ncbi:MAG TPA: hypothetical protein VHP83_10505 [Aggregatilineaceae bacterium]|nr:hypothetical protein [Aggregatilineaceae bacterium]
MPAMLVYNVDIMATEEKRSTVIRHTVEEYPWRNQTQWAATLTLVVIVGIIIGALYLIQSTTTTTTARVLEQMTDQRDRLVRENERLNAEIAEMQSLPRMQTRAAELGFRPANPDEDIMYVIVEGYRYDRPPSTSTPTPPPTQTIAAYDDTFSGWMQMQWDSFKEQLSEWSGDD